MNPAPYSSASSPTPSRESLAAISCSGSSLPWDSGRVISWFSCGAASAVATKKAIEKYGTVGIYYTDTGSEHPDNHRFLADCEKWFGQKITTLKSTEYADAMEVCERQRFLSLPNGAPCTSAMKKTPANGIWGLGDVEIFGYTADEKHRLNQWIEDNTERRIECPLINLGISKSECFDILLAAGIDLPTMYKLGFRNNNCIGCVKARDAIDYWKRVRLHFPAHFERVAKLEKELGYAINRVTRKGVKYDVPLYDIPPGDPKGADPKISCGLFCMSEADSSSLPHHPATMKTNPKNERSFVPHQGPLTPQKELFSLNEALAALGLSRRDVHSDWLVKRWQGEIKWSQKGKRLARKAYAPNLVESIRNDPEFEAIKFK